ncbi:MAG: hypothetical protein CME60_01610 [Halobacteriovoraceae bacterium]|nr:hypothetical protein [Halobacteriovoraceae bacterium]|tara:strand:+ start:946 stop:1443 length:498 start_codon:yes stop_codon:yes gene_type:complete
MNLKIAITATVLLTMTQSWASRSDLFVFKTKHQGYTCERWGKKGYKESDFEKSGFRFESLDISRNTRKARVNVLDSDRTCRYTSIFNRNKGEIFVTFESSEVTPLKEGAHCDELKADMDEFMAPGWNYEIKQNKYLSVEFPSGIESECSEQTGQSFARFYYDLLG